MPRPKKDAEAAPIPLESAMSGILALLVDERDRAVAGDKDAPKTEVLLARSGMGIEDISRVTGKKYDAVRMTISRGRSE